LLKVANCIHIREKLVQIVITFLILGIVVIWCHSFTKFISAGRNAQQQVHFLNILLWFVPSYLLFYLSYILRSRLRTTRQTSSSTTSSIAPEEARPTAILGTTLEEEARLAMILSTNKCRCLHVFTPDL
jgi:hypothetical protein